MRIISWTVVIGSITAILYGGVRPLLQDLRLPEINASQVSGTAVRPVERGANTCANTVPPDGQAGKAGEQPATCDDPTPGEQ